ncbi:DUF2625 family protein [Paenibacillus pinisoli]|uniref:DUF2625 family protein n=1 Tax=Paenibacillus pinisoli TaxID=1276110 RepID=A0A3A6PQJ8_9BACL|nr:DUF2625 family protein [Paenibacillus pinisoli]RJX41876.1 DUF2625 family protein [Paenibacillus pinisoli]
MKTLNELVLQQESTWLMVQEWVTKATNNVEILPANKQDASKVLHQLQVTTKSFLGVVSYYTGGILVEHGWLRFLGSGSDRLPRSLTSWNGFDSTGKSPRMQSSILIADDAVGGFYAMNGSAFEGKPGEIYYLAPDTLEWESLDMQYSDFLKWAFLGDVRKYYESFQWDNWVEDVSRLDGDKGILIYPFLWAEGKASANRTRAIVPIEELWNVNMVNRENLGIQ